MEDVYEPREDSFLLASVVKKCAFGSVLDMGTGSGIQALTAAKVKKVKSVVGVDKNPEVVKYCKKNVVDSRVSFIESDLFSFFSKKKSVKKGNSIPKRIEKTKSKQTKFDTIIFNPPYLPQDKGITDDTLYGGKHGYELIVRFLDSVNDYLSSEGIILLLFSSLTNKDKVDEAIRLNMLESELVAKQHIFFEDLFVYKVKKSSLLKKIEKKGVTCINYLTRGRRGIVFTGQLEGKKVAIKAKSAASRAVGRIENEANWFKILNKKGIGPKLVCSSRDYLVYEFVEGEFMLKYLEHACRKEVINVIDSVFDQMFILDKLGVDKEEMHHPYKHVLISKKGKVTLLDFERCNKTENPKNVTQFCQCVNSMSKTLVNEYIKINKDEMIKLAKDYKQRPNKTNLEMIKDGWKNE